MSDYDLICTVCGHHDEAPFDVGDVCPRCDNGNLVDEYSYNAGRQLGRKEGMREAAEIADKPVYDKVRRSLVVFRDIGKAIRKAAEGEG